MSWEDFLLPIKLSQEVRQFQNNKKLNKKFDGKYLGIIPLVWNPLAFYKKSNHQTIEEQINDININTNTNNTPSTPSTPPESQNVKIIKTTKDMLMIESAFYYLTRNTDKNNNKNERYYPVLKYEDDLPFTINHLKDVFGKFLFDIGYTEPHFKPIRIYKMKGFHLFGLILDYKISNDKLNKNWNYYYSLPLIKLKDSEITNSMMKVSQNHYNYSNNNTWTIPIKGYVIETNTEFPFNINFEQLIATLSNQIDSNSSKYTDFYFIPKINKNKRPLDADLLTIHQANKKIKF
uniref:Uncharacterized protein n=1 Tax=viral metagenome TaxID=1070528 RepID=A0A6C0E9C2_9ZZZZ